MQRRGGSSKTEQQGTKYKMLEFCPGEEERARINVELTCAGICPKGIEMFYSLYGQYCLLDAYDWMFRSCFMKDLQFTDDCVIMQFGDLYPKDGFKGGIAAELAAQHNFGSFTRKAMFNSIVLSTITLTIGRHSNESSLCNFAKHCPEAIRKRIEDEISEESLEKIDGFEDLRKYRDKRAAHHDLNLGEIRLLYSTLEECVQRILRAMKVVYPELNWTVDWRKREDIVSQDRKPTQWTTDPGEPFIVQSLKELAIRRRWEKLQNLAPYVENSEFARLKRDEILAEIEKIRAS